MLALDCIVVMDSRMEREQLKTQLSHSHGHGFNFVHCMHWHWTVSLGFFCWAGVQVDVCHGHSVFHQLTAPIALIVAVCAHHMCITNEHLDQGQGRGNGTLCKCLRVQLRENGKERRWKNTYTRWALSKSTTRLTTQCP